MIVVAVTRVLRLFIGLAFAPAVPVQVGPQGGSRQENLDGRVIVASEGLVRVVDLKRYSNANLPSE